MDGFWMNERDLEAEQAVPRLGVDQLGAAVGELGERRPDVVDLVRDVVHPGAALGEELADGRLVAERREQLDAALAEAERRRLDSLVGDRLPVLERRPEEALVRRDRLVEVGYGHAEVVDPPRLHPARSYRALVAGKRHDPNRADRLRRARLALDVVE